MKKTARKPLENRALAESAPIEVSDSGVGGLTVLRAPAPRCRPRISCTSATRRGCLTAPRVPSRSGAGQTRRPDAAAARRQVLVVACNTASAVAIDVLTGRVRASAGAWGARARCDGRVPCDAQCPHRGHRDREHRARRRVPGGDRAPPAERGGRRARVSVVRRARRGRLDRRSDRRRNRASISRRPVRGRRRARASRHARARLRTSPS